MSEPYPCCACCEDVAKFDHVEHGGHVEKDGHDLPCTACNDWRREWGLLAKAWDEGYRSGFSNAMRRMSDEPDAPTTPNPYAPTHRPDRDQTESEAEHG